MKTSLASFVLLLQVALTPQQAAEARRVERKLLSPCCYAQPVSQHMSDVAEQMREDITAMVAAGQDDDEIIDHYKSVYGERILVVPDGQTGRILFVLPTALCLLSIVAIICLLRKLLRAAPAASGLSFPEIPPDRYETIRRQIEKVIREMDE